MQLLMIDWPMSANFTVLHFFAIAFFMVFFMLRLYSVLPSPHVHLQSFRADADSIALAFDS